MISQMKGRGISVSQNSSLDEPPVLSVRVIFEIPHEIHPLGGESLQLYGLSPMVCALYGLQIVSKNTHS